MPICVFALLSELKAILTENKSQSCGTILLSIVLDVSPTVHGILHEQTGITHFHVPIPTPRQLKENLKHVTVFETRAEVDNSDDTWHRNLTTERP